MSSFTLKASARFPNGTSVGAYQGSSRNEGAAPSGAAVNTQTVANGEAVFTGLADFTAYVAYGLVGGRHRYVTFTTGASNEVVVPGTGSSTTYGAGTPASLEDGQMHVQTDGADPASVTGLWLGIDGAPKKVLDATPDQLYGTGADRPTNANEVSDGTVYRVNDSATVPAGNYQAQNGQWVAVSTAASTVVFPLARVSGEVAIASGTERYYFPTPGTIKNVDLGLAEGPSSGHVIADVNLNGTSIFTDQAKRPDVARGAHWSSKAPDVTAFQAGDYLTVDFDEVGVEPTGLPAHIAEEAFSTTSLQVTRVVGAQTGDLQLVFWYVLGTADIDVPSTNSGEGWVLVNDGGTAYSGGLYRIYVFWRLDDGAAGPWTFVNSNAGTFTTGTRNHVLVRDVHQTTPIDDADLLGKSFTTAGTGPASNVAHAPTREYLYTRSATSRRVVDGANPGDAGYTLIRGFNENLAGSTHLAHINRDSNNATLASPTVTWDAAANSVVARVQVRGVDDPAAEWTPGSDALVTVRYTET